MKVEIQRAYRSEEGTDGLPVLTFGVEVRIGLSHEETAIIKTARIEGEVFIETWPTEEERDYMWPTLKGQLLHRPTVRYEDLLKGEPFFIRPISYQETGFMELEREIHKAAERSKTYMEHLKFTIQNRRDVVEVEHDPGRDRRRNR